MTYRPQRSGKKEIILSLSAATVAILLILISGITDRFGGLYQISAIIAGVISIELYMKYVGSHYVYEAADECFRIYKITGKKSICVSSLDYEMSLSLVVNNDEYLKNKSDFPSYNFNVNMCKNLAPDNYSVYFFEFDGKKTMMKFEPDEIFTEYINDKITSAWKKAEESDEIED